MLNHPVLLVAESAGRRETLKDALRPSSRLIFQLLKVLIDFINSMHAIAITNAPLDRGLLLSNQAQCNL